MHREALSWPGDPGPLEAAFLRERARLLAFLRRGSGDAAEDLVQELWLKVRQRDANAVSDPTAYLFRMAYTLILDHRRQRQRAGARDHAWQLLVGGERPHVSDAPSAERAAIASDLLAAAERQLDWLGEPTATIFRMHRIDGIAQREVAARLRMGLSTVEKHLRKAYQAMLTLKDRLDEV